MVTAVLIVVLIFLLLLFFSFLILAGFTVFDLFLPAPFVATKKEQVLKMIEIAGIKKGDKAIDLGSGDGRLVIEAAKKGAQALGVEKNPFLFLLSKVKIKLEKSQAKVILGDIFAQDLSNADIIFLYLNPKLLEKLAQKLKEELKTGTKVVSNRYQIPGLRPIKNFDNIFLYQI